MSITHWCKCRVFDSLESTPVTAMKLYFRNVSLSLVCNFTHANHPLRKKNAESPTIDVSGIIICYETFRKLLCWTSSHRHHQLLNLSLLLEKVPKINKCTCILGIRVKMCILNFNEIIPIKNNFPEIKQEQTAFDWRWSISKNLFFNEANEG